MPGKWAYTYTVRRAVRPGPELHVAESLHAVFASSFQLFAPLSLTRTRFGRTLRKRAQVVGVVLVVVYVEVSCCMLGREWQGRGRVPCNTASQRALASMRASAQQLGSNLEHGTNMVLVSATSNAILRSVPASAHVEAHRSTQKQHKNHAEARRIVAGITLALQGMLHFCLLAVSVRG